MFWALIGLGTSLEAVAFTGDLSWDILAFELLNLSFANILNNLARFSGALLRDDDLFHAALLVGDDFGACLGDALADTSGTRLGDRDDDFFFAGIGFELLGDNVNNVAFAFLSKASGKTVGTFLVTASSDLVLLRDTSSASLLNAFSLGF